MKKKLNFIQINGFTGILLVVFILCCAATGFIVFPSWCCMHIWNFVANFVNFPQMTIIHGGILWAIFALTLFALSQNKAPIKIGSVKDLNDGDVKKVLNDIKEKNMNAFTKEIEEKDNVKVNKEN